MTGTASRDDDLAGALDRLLDDLPPLGTLPQATVLRGARRRRTRIAALSGAGALVVAGGALLLLPGPSDEALLPADRAPVTVPPLLTAAPRPPAPPLTTATPVPVPPPSTATVPPRPSTAPVPTVSPAGPAASTRPATPSATGTPSAPAATPTGAATTPAPAPAVARVVLRPDGLGLAAGSSTSALLFGQADAAGVRGALDRLRGPASAVALPDCGARVTVARYGGLQVFAEGERFVGWSEDGADSATGDGVSVGTTLAELRESFADVQVRHSTLGTEWTAGALGGLLDGDGEQSTVTRLAAGSTCLFR